MFERILVPLDGSAFAEWALPPALGVARGAGGEIRLLTVHETVPAFAFGELDEAARSWAEEYLAEVSRRVSPLIGERITTCVRTGPVAEGIQGEAEAWSADLVVLATHGRGAVSRVWLGSVADRCLRHLDVPLLLVRPSESERVDLEAPLVPGRLVVPLDGSELAEAALEPALALADRFDAPLTLVRAVVYPHGLSSPYLPDTIAINRAVLEETGKAAADYLEQVADRLRKRGVEVDTRSVTAGQAAQAILDEAQDDWIALATHGRGGLGRVLLGSVADKVIRGALGPVVALRPST